jgi:hypothetical protein
MKVVSCLSAGGTLFNWLSWDSQPTGGQWKEMGSTSNWWHDGRPFVPDSNKIMRRWNCSSEQVQIDEGVFSKMILF